MQWVLSVFDMFSNALSVLGKNVESLSGTYTGFSYSIWWWTIEYRFLRKYCHAGFQAQHIILILYFSLAVVFLFCLLLVLIEWILLLVFWGKVTVSSFPSFSFAHLFVFSPSFKAFCFLRWSISTEFLLRYELWSRFCFDCAKSFLSVPCMACVRSFHPVSEVVAFISGLARVQERQWLFILQLALVEKKSPFSFQEDDN